MCRCRRCLSARRCRRKGSRYGRRRRHRGSVYGGIYRIGGSCSFDLREFSHVEEEKQYRKIAENVEKIYREKSRQLAPEKLEKVYERRVLKGNAEAASFSTPFPSANTRLNMLNLFFFGSFSDSSSKSSLLNLFIFDNSFLGSAPAKPE